jgi:hypothetical protein
MTPHLESAPVEKTGVEQKKTSATNEKVLEKIAGIRAYLGQLEKTNIYYPFNYETIFSLYSLKDKAPEAKALIDEKQTTLRQILAAINLEKEKKFWIPGGSNDEIAEVLEELTASGEDKEARPATH